MARQVIDDQPDADGEARGDELKKIMERVEKLLALAKSDNENEAALAMAQAQRLMSRYSIKEGMLHAEEGLKEIPLAEAARFPTWLTRLYIAVGVANGAVAMFYKHKTSTEIRFIGKRVDIIMARNMARYVESEIERFTYPLSLIRNKVWTGSYREGLVDTVSLKLKEATRAAAQEMEDEGGTGMVLYVEERAKKIMEELERDAGCKKKRIESKAQGHADARLMGQIDGMEIDPHFKGKGLNQPARGNLPGEVEEDETDDE